MRTLTAAVAVVTMVMVACLGFAGIGDAQTTGLQVQGTLAGVDCQSQQLTLNTSGGSTTVQSTNQSALYLNGAPIALCSLASYTGAAATATVVPDNSTFVLGQLNVTAHAAAAPAPATVSSGSSVLGIALGALAIGALAYMIGRNSAPAPQPVPAYNNNGYNNNYRGQGQRCQTNNNNNNNQYCHR
ncbi:MAG TPA: hypothetical protein VK587_11195 [bacterium]|nr:hypothetical protein [bacterium]